MRARNLHRRWAQRRSRSRRFTPGSDVGLPTHYGRTNPGGNPLHSVVWALCLTVLLVGTRCADALAVPPIEGGGEPATVVGAERPAMLVGQDGPGLVIGSSVLGVLDEECPNGCLCKWSGGKQTAECGAAQLTEVPEGLSRDTQVLNLTGNAIPVLGAREFHRKGYASLQRIYVSKCGISQIAPSAFHLLTNLVELDLSANQLQRVPTSALSDCGALRRLSLSHNPIETLHDDAFKGLSRLGTLELNHCRLAVVESLAFRGLRSLEFLRMAHNLLTRIPPSALTDHLPPQLYGVNLEENPWTCNCEMRQVRQWMEENNIPLSAPPKCAHPHRLQGISWQALELADFACPPELVAIDAVTAALEAENATIRCEVETQPASGTSISWSFNGRPIRNMSLISFGRQLYVVREEESLGRLKTSVLTIVNAFVKDSGSYMCLAANRAGNVSGHAVLHVYPREEFGPLTFAEIAGVVLGFLLTLVVLVGAVYMVMQQYQSYCQQRAGTAGSALDGHGECALKGGGGPDKNGSASLPLKEKAKAVKIPAKPTYETVVSLTTKAGNGHVGVDLVNSTNDLETLAPAFTELRSPPGSESRQDVDPEGGSSSNGSEPTAGGRTAYDRQPPQVNTASGGSTLRALSGSSMGAPPPTGGLAPSRLAAAAPKLASTFEKNNASLVNAIASELEEKIANRVIENLNLRNRQALVSQQVAPVAAGRARPLSEDLDDLDVPPPPAPKEAICAKTNKDVVQSACKQRPNGSVSARIVHGGVGGGQAAGVVQVANAGHLQLDRRGESRDSPDEGLGDERDYEADEGLHT